MHFHANIGGLEFHFGFGVQQGGCGCQQQGEKKPCGCGGNHNHGPEEPPEPANQHVPDTHRRGAPLG